MPIPRTDLLSERHARLRSLVASRDLDGLVVTSPSNIRYLTNHVGTAGVAVVTQVAVHLVVDGRYAEAVRVRQNSAHACPGLVVHAVPASYEEALAGCLLSLGSRRVGIEAAHVSIGRLRAIERALARQSPIRLEETTDLVEGLRLVKDAAEVATLRDAAARLSAVARAVFPQIREGLSEREAAGFVEAALRAAGYERPAFEVIAASGPNSALPHHRAEDRVMRAGDLLVLDFGGVLDGYCSDVTRTIAVGHPTEDARRLHAAVLDAQRAAIAAVSPGVLSSDVDAAARSVLEARGLGDVFLHGTGHGLGLDIHEAPRVGKPRAGEQPTMLAPGMVITIEPGAYVSGFGGVRIEDDVLVTEHGCDILTSIPHGIDAVSGSWT